MFTKYLDPKNDVAFRKIFGTEKNQNILIHFLNDMITFKENGPIISVTFLDTVQDPETLAQKTSIVDILCKDEKGNQYIVEMQVAKEKGFTKRAQYYASKAYCTQGVKGGKYEDLKEVIFLAIADFVMFPQKSDYKSDHVILDRKSQENDLRDFSFTFIELPKFNKDIDHLSNMTEKWAYFFKHAESSSPEERVKLVGDDKVIEEAYEQLDAVGWSDKDILKYDQAEKYEGAYLASLTQKFDEGKTVGRAEGRSEGKTEGRLEEKIKNARKMIQKKYPLSEIAEITGLSLDQIKEIAARLQSKAC